MDWKGHFIRQMLYALAQHRELTLQLWSPPGEVPPNVSYLPSKNEQRWLASMLEKGGIANLLRNRPITGFFSGVKLVSMLRRVCRKGMDADLVHINWLQNAIPFRNSATPLVVSVLGSDFAMLDKPGMVTLLRSVFKNRPVTLCPNAQWMEQKLTEYFGDVATIKYIPLGIDNGWFDIEPRPGDEAPRKWLVVLRVTPQKIGPLFEWGEEIFGENDELHLFGPMQNPVSIPGWVHYHGATYPSELMADWFPGAAGLISLSRHDEGRPQILMEAMAAGVPVIVSDIAGHRDLVAHGETGMIVDSKESFASAVVALQQGASRSALITNAKEWITEEIGTWSDCAERYIEVYNSMLGHS
jgi:glycosyltransferase involved in cell wall biosynthesis